MTLRAAVIFLLFSLPLAGGDVFPLGGGEPGPAVGPRAPAAIGSNANGYLVAWTDGRDAYEANALYVARFDRTGTILDPEGIFAAPASRSVTRVRIASDGADYLLLSSVEGNVTAVRVTRDGVATRHPLGRIGDVEALQWNGRHYVALLGDWGGSAAILLDRDGRAVSGELAFLHSRGNGPMIMACRNRGKCFVARRHGYPVSIRGGVVSESMFPPVGARVERNLPPLFPGYRVAIAATDDGYVAVTADRTRMTVWRFGDGGDLLDDYTVEVPAVWNGPEIVATGVAIDVLFESGPSYEKVLARLTPRGAALEQLPRRTELVGSGPAGIVAVWRESQRCIFGTCAEVFFGFRGTPGWRGAGTLLSQSRAAERMPRLARGPASILGTWVETRNADEVRVRMLDRDGRPRTAPAVVGSAPIVRELLAAFDGVNYLVVWEEKPENNLSNLYGASTVYGRFVSQDGQLAGDRFLIGRGAPLGSLAWNGRAYMVTVGASVIHLGTAGAELARASYPFVTWRQDPPDILFLAHDPETKQYAGLAGALWSSRIAVGPLWFVEYAPVALPDDLQWKEGCCLTGESFPSEWGYVAPAIEPRKDGLFFLTYGGGWGYSTDPERDPLPFPDAAPSHVDSVRIGDEVFVAAGAVLSRHALDGTLLAHRVLDPRAFDSALIDDGDALLVLVQRERLFAGISRIEIRREER